MMMRVTKMRYLMANAGVAASDEEHSPPRLPRHPAEQATHHPAQQPWGSRLAQGAVRRHPRILPKKHLRKSIQGLREQPPLHAIIS